MCGLAGIWLKGGGVADTVVVERMLDQIAHRGPDDAGMWHSGNIALGHRRLAILDTTPNAHQPMLTADGQGVLIYNGQVYNFQALRRELEAEGVAFHSTGDTEVVLQALHLWGPKRSIPRFNGMFALAYLDRRRSELWLARDRVGIKPLLVADIGSALLLASEVKALLAHPEMRRRVDENGLTKWIIRPRRAAHRTLFEGIDGPEPGSWWKIDSSGIEKHRYFHVLADVDVERIVDATRTNPGGQVDAVEGLIRRSVALHMASDVPLAVMCSGGVDSSLITAFAHAHAPGVTAYVADFPFGESEAPQAKLVGGHLGVEIRPVRVERDEFLRLWPLAVWHSDGPLTHPSDPALLAVARTCRKQGMKVLLTGEGADELFGGYSKYRHTYRRWRFHDWPRRWLFLNDRQRANARGALMASPFATEGSLASVRRRLSVALDGDDAFLPQRLLALLQPVKLEADRALIAHCLADMEYSLSLLLHRHDRMGMAASIEMRVPFLENDLIDFAFHLPRRARLHRRTGKWVLKKAAERLLPSKVVYAKKRGFPAPGFLSRGTDRLLAGGALARQMQWPAAATNDIIAIIRDDPELRFFIVGIELWLRLFFNGESVENLGEQLVALAA